MKVQGRIKCQKCNGKGGYFKKSMWTEVFVPCLECNGKGSWWPNKKPQIKK